MIPNEAINVSPTYTNDSVLGDLSSIIVQIIGEQYADQFDIGMATSFSKELELESIELVALAEQLRARYGEQLDLASWLGTMELEEIINLKVGDLVEQIVQCMSAPTTV